MTRDELRRATPSLAAALLALAGAALAAPSTGALAFPWIGDAGRVAASLAAVLVLASPFLPGSRRTLGLGLAAVLATAALAALFGRHAEWHRSPFEVAHGAFAGFPSHLPFLGLGAASLVLLRDPAALLARRALVVSTLWAAAVLLMPRYDLGEGRLPLLLGLDLLDDPARDLASRLGGAVLFLLAIPAAAGLGAAVAFARDAEVPRPALAAAASGAALVVLHAFAAPAALSGAGASGFGTGLLLAGTLLLAAAAGRDLLRAPPLDERGARLSLRAAGVAVPAVVLALYGLLKTHGMGPSDTDENIYFYMAADLRNGRLPYVDYFFAHPPFHVLLPGTVLAVTGWSLALAKLFAPLASGISGLAVWALGRRAFGVVPAAFAMVAFLFAAELLKASTNMTGINLTVMWMTLGLLASVSGRPRTAGVLLGLAATTGFYSMAAVSALLVLGFFRDLRFAKRQLVSFAVVFGVVNLAFLLVAGDAFVDGVYRYHGLKAMREKGMIDVFGGPKDPLRALLQNLGVLLDGKPFRKDLYYHAHLWWAGLLAPFLGLALWLLGEDRKGERRSPWRFFDPRRFTRDDADGTAALLFAVTLALFVQFAMFRELYSFYFVLVYPTLALLLGWFVGRALDLAAEAVATGSPRRPARLAAAALAIGLFALWEPVAAGAQKVFPDEFEELGKRNDYTWTEAPVLPGLSFVVRGLFWEDSRRKGDMERGYRHYLWNKKRRFATLDEIATYVRDRTSEDETIAGASTTAPLVALAAGRRIAAGEVDTNNKRFKTGLLREPDYWNAICADRVRFVVSTGMSYFTPERMEGLPTARRWFRLAKTFLDPELRFGGPQPIRLYERQGEPPGPGLVCRWEE